MKAFISPTEYVVDKHGGVLGNRVVEFSQDGFPIAAPFFWVDCDVAGDPEYYYYAEGSIHAQVISVSTPTESYAPEVL